STPLICSDSLVIVTIICNDIPQDLSFTIGQLGFVVKCDETVKNHRLVVATPPHLVEFAPMCSLHFRQVVPERDRAAVGNQGGDVALMQIETNDWNT
ncbi:hypothetical protein M427DRAFT_90512, partial [Gonapodya prolifera JEL478]